MGSKHKRVGLGLLTALVALLLAVSLWKAKEQRAEPAAARPAAPTSTAESGQVPGDLPEQFPDGGERSSVEESSSANGSVREKKPGDGLEARPGCALRIQLLDAHDGQPLPGFRLEIASPSIRDSNRPLRFEYVSDADGWVETEPTIPRGQLQFVHLSEEGHERYERPWEIRPRTASVLAGVGETEELVLRAAIPSVVVKIEARLASGSPVVDSRVVLVEGKPGDDGGIDWFFWRYAETDSEGSASFCLYGDLTARPFAAQVFEPVAGEVCDPLMIAAPIGSGPHRIQTYPGGRIELVVRDAEDRLVADVEVSCWFKGLPMMRLRADDRTAADGRVSFEPLPAGPYRVALGHSPITGEKVSPGTEILLARGEVREIVLRPDGEPPSRLVVSGRVLEPDGSPAPEVSLGLLLDNELHHRLRTDEDGRFEFYSREEWNLVVVSSATSIFVDPIEPRELRVRAGTTDLEFRKIALTEQVQVNFQLLDAETGEPIADDLDAAIVIYRKPPEGSPVLGLARFGTVEGGCCVDLRPHSELAWRVLAPGYRVQGGNLDAPLPGEEVPLLEVRLDQGFERELIVRDTSGGARLAGVLFRDTSGSVIARTGADGSALLTGDEWPGELSVELDGFEPLIWDARIHWSNWGKQLWLQARE